MFTLGLPEDAPVRFKKMVFAAAKAYFLNEPAETIRKEFGAGWTLFNRRSNAQKLLPEIFQFVRFEVANIIMALPQTDRNMTCEGQGVGSAAVFRLTTTFEMTMLCMKVGYWIEAAALIKQIIEQIAWVYAIRAASYAELQAISPSSCISGLKDIYPKVGLLYGLINEVSHVHPKKTHSYLRVVKKEIRVTLASPKESLKLAYTLLLTVDLMGICSEICFEPGIHKFRFTRQVNGQRRANANRKALLQIIHFWNRLDEMLIKTRPTSR